MPLNVHPLSHLSQGQIQLCCWHLLHAGAINIPDAGLNTAAAAAAATVGVTATALSETRSHSCVQDWQLHKPACHA
jgi:hypothetical protein